MPYHRPGEWEKRTDIRQEVGKTLRDKLTLGESKQAAKEQLTSHRGIYSTATYNTYTKACQNFASYVIKNDPKGHNITLKEARAYARGFIEKEIAEGKSPYTIKMERAALGKLYGCRGVDICEYVPQRAREDITRSRNRTTISEKTGKEIKNQSTRAGHFSEKNNQTIVDFCKSTGLRRCELSSLRGNQLWQDGNGKYWIEIEKGQAKGGRVRDVPIRGNVDLVVDLMEKAGSDKVFKSVPKKMDVHHYRSVYASELYKELARPTDQIPAKERYCCRGDLKGTWYDKKAMLEVSHALGHNRISVIAEHYLR